MKRSVYIIVGLFTLMFSLIIPDFVSANTSVNPVPNYDDWRKNTSFLFISDSFLIGTTDHLHTLAPEAELNSKSGRALASFDEEVTDTALDQALNTNAPIVFVALGLDQPVSMDQVNEFITKVLEESRSVKNIVFVTSASNTENKNLYNSNVSNVANANQHVYIVEWEQHLAGQDLKKYYEKDGKFLLYPDQYYDYIFKDTYEQMVENMPLVTKEEFVDIPAPVTVQYNPQIPYGKSDSVQSGEKGQKLVRLTYNTFMGMPVGSPVVDEEVIKEPIPQIIAVGPGAEEESVSEEIKTVPFETIVQENDQLDQGVTRVIQAGVPGTKSIKRTIIMIEGEPQGDPVIEEKILSEPVNEILEQGTGQKEIRTNEVVEEIPFSTEKIEDDLLLKGDEVIAQEGVVGRKKVITKTPYFNGQVSGDSVVSEKILEEPQPEIIKVGTAEKKDAIYDADGPDAEKRPFPIGLVIGGITFLLVAVVGVFMYNKLSK